MAKRIGIFNQKGGVGKTSVATGLAAALADLGHQVLVVDGDPSCGATLCLGHGKDEPGTYEAMTGQPVSVVRALHDDLDLLPAQTYLQAFEADASDGEARRALRRALDDLDPAYDFTIIDTQPTSSILVHAAYVAADFVLVPTTPSMLAEHALNDVLDHLADTLESWNPHLRLLGVVANQVRARDTAHQAHVEAVRELDGFPCSIRLTKVLEGAQRHGKTTFQYRPKNGINDDFRAVAREVLSRISSLGDP